MAEYTTIVDPGNEQVDWETDYTSLNAWEAGEQELYSADDVAIADCRRSTIAKDTAGVNFNGWTSGVAIKIEVHADYRHEGVWADQRDDGNYIYVHRRDSGYNLYANEDSLEVYGLLIENVTDSSNAVFITVSSGSGTSTQTIIVDDCIIKGKTFNDTSLHIAIGVAGGNPASGSTVEVTNSIVFGINNDSTGTCRAFRNNKATREIILYNVTVHDVKDGVVYSAGNGVLVKNCIATGMGVDAFQGNNYSTGSDYNISSDTTAPGTNSITSAVVKDATTDTLTAAAKDTDNWVIFSDPDNGDFSLHSEVDGSELNDAIGAGIGPSSDSDVPTTDIIGTTRSGTTCDIGAFEYVAAGSTYTLDAAAGTYSLTGTAASLLISRLISAAAGSITLSGQDASLLHGRLVSAGAGEMTLTGQAASLLYGRLVVAGAGSITLTGTDADLLRTAVLAASLGEYAISGTDAGLLRGMVLSAGAGTVEITGMDVTLTYVEGLGLTAESGTFTLTGSDASLLVGRKLSAESGTITLDGQAASLLFGRLISSGVGSVTITGADASLLRGLNLSAEAGSMDLTGQDVTLTWSGLTLPSGAVSITFTVAKPAVTFSASKPSVTFAATKPSITFSTN